MPAATGIWEGRGLVATLIGIDVGTTAVKAVLVTLDGHRLADFSRPHPMHRAGANAAEQDPADWMRSVLAALTSFAERRDLSGLAGIGICSQVNTHVFVDGSGGPVRPAITWQDGRAAADAATIDAQVSAAQKLEWFGGPVPIDASHALSRMAFVARTEPEVFAHTRHVLLPKDYCVMQLTGAVGSDPISAVGLVDQRGYVAPLLDLVLRAAEVLPPLHGFTHVAGRVRAGLPCVGTPVVTGTMDAWGGMFGLGVSRDGDAMLQSGTSEIAGIVSDHVEPTAGVVLFPAYDGIRMHAAPTQAGGAALQWFAEVLGKSAADLSAMAETSDPSESTPLFLPHLQGERAPIWDSATRGVFARLDGRADATAMSRAVMEGVAFSVRWAFEALQASAGRRVEVVNIGGGGSRSDVWTQIKADVLGVPLRRAAIADSAAMGAALLAGVGSGAFGSLERAVRGLIQFDRTFEPRSEYRALYDGRYGKFRELYDALCLLNASYHLTD
ncbi:MAG: FGGY-family carbohydrate kinase [Devosia sp.]